LRKKHDVDDDDGRETSFFYSHVLIVKAVTSWNFVTLFWVRW